MVVFTLKINETKNIYCPYRGDLLNYYLKVQLQHDNTLFFFRNLKYIFKIVRGFKIMREYLFLSLAF